uniref:Aminotran_1_2 domain-containing protein n=1 Tax=Trichuris muris TaxID=70415 RepID=A0A5S6R4N3_TRIMR
MIGRSLLCSRSLLQTKRRLTSGLSAVLTQLNEELNGIKAAGTFKEERVIAGAQNVRVQVVGFDHPVLNFCANNYLGLSSHPDVINGAKQALDTHGAGLSSVRFICGTQDIHRNLERLLAQFHGKEEAILYASCFDANAGIFEVLLGDKDAVLTDELNHASLIDGMRLCKAKKLRYKHLDMSDLEAKLKLTKDSRRRLIATDGAFSMDGDVAPLDQIVMLANKYNAAVLVDDCHATGFFGPTGRGTEEYFGLKGEVDLINSTLGKAVGGAMGGYTCGPKPVIDLLRQRSRPYLFSNSLAPPVVGSATRAVQMLMDNNDLAKTLLSKTNRFRTQMKAAGFTVIGNPAHPICPVMLGEAKLAAQFADQLLNSGIYAIGFSYPVVPHGKARIRVQISAAHSEEDIDHCVNAFRDVGKRLHVVS